MRVLIDECIDWRLSQDIVGHEVKTARQMDRSAIRNGELLSLAEKEFDVFVSVDRNLSFQQHLPKFAIFVCLLCARSNRLKDLQPLVRALLEHIQNAQSGGVRFIRESPE